MQEFREYLDKQELNYEYKNEEQLKKIEKKLADIEEFENIEEPFEKVYNIYAQMRSKEFEKNKEIIKRRLKGEFATLKGGTEARVESTLEYDKVLDKALEVLQDEEDYLNILGYAEE